MKETQKTVFCLAEDNIEMFGRYRSPARENKLQVQILKDLYYSQGKIRTQTKGRLAKCWW